MIDRHKQQGMTAIGWMGVIALIALATLFALRLIPVYLDGFKVGSVLDSVEEEYQNKNVTPVQITKTIMKRLDINMVTDITKDDIYISLTGKNMLIEIDYEVRKPLMGNVDIIVNTQKSVTLQIQ